MIANVYQISSTYNCDGSLVSLQDCAGANVTYRSSGVQDWASELVFMNGE
jgi:hypothetical protein